jgi:hypothetical protein
LNLEEWTIEICKFDKTLYKGKKKGDRRSLAFQISKHGLIEACQLCGGADHGAKTCKRFLGEKRTCYNCGERGHLSRDCPKPRENRKVDQAEQHYMKAKKAFKAAKVKANKASKKKLKAKTPTPPSSTSSSSDDDEDKESSSSSDDDEDSSSSEDSDGTSRHKVVNGRVAKVKAATVKVKKGKGTKKGLPTHKTYLEATSPVSSSESHLSWEDYNAKSEKAGKLTRSRSWDGTIDHIDARLNGESSGTPRIYC